MQASYHKMNRQEKLLIGKVRTRPVWTDFGLFAARLFVFALVIWYNPF